MSTPVHLVGRVACDSPEEVFAAAGKLLGPCLKRVPDGEPGGRRMWISWQIPLLRANPDHVPAYPPDETGYRLIPLKLRGGVRPEDLHFRELGYAREARPSYQDFLDARRAGTLPADVRFQVCLPTPYAVVGLFCVPETCTSSCWPTSAPCCERSNGSPPPSRTRTWPSSGTSASRCCSGMGAGLPRRPSLAWSSSTRGTFQRLSEAVPEEIELGFHLCDVARAKLQALTEDAALAAERLWQQAPVALIRMRES